MILKILSGVSLRLKIFAAFVLIVIGGTTISTLIGSRVITSAMLNQAHKRVAHGLEAARLVYSERLNDVGRMIMHAASANTLVDAVSSGMAKALPDLLLAQQKKSGLGFLSFVDPKSSTVVRAAGTSSESPAEFGFPIAELVKTAMAGEVTASTEVVNREFLLEEDPELARKAHIQIVPVPRAAPDRRKEVDSGLVLIAAAPVNKGAQVVGVLYGGVLLNRNFEIVDRVKQIIYGGETYQGRDIGTVTIFMQDVRVSTNVTTRSGERAVGTRVSAEVAEQVLSQGQRWYGRAFVVDDWYLTAYEPIRNHSDRIIGILYVGMQERPFLAVRTQMMLTFLVVAVVGVLIVLALTYLFTRSMILPLEEVVAATKRITGGDLDHSVKVHSRDEIGYLAVHFNKMLASLKSMKRELQEWAYTLEKKVEERTEELMAVQARMAQSEKLASLGRLAAGVAHEINNPLGGVMAFSMLLLEDCGAGHPMREKLEIIVKQTLRCREIVKGLLDFSRQSEAKASLTEINSVVDNTISLLDRQTMFHNIQTNRKFREDLPPVLIDAHQLQQVIMNMVLNAVDAMEESGTLTVETNREAEEVLIRISDTGKGIPEEIMAYIFEPFFTTKKVGQGTGLGLAIAHGIVSQAGGKIDVSSSSSGTTFTVRLPVAEQEQ